MEATACKDCPKRTVGCHGKDEDGNWKCPMWAAEMEHRAQEERSQADRELARRTMNDYLRENIAKTIRRKRNHKGPNER